MASFATTTDATTTFTSTTSTPVISTIITSTTDILTTSPTTYTDLTSRLLSWNGNVGEGSTWGTEDAEVDPESTGQEVDANCDDQAGYDDTEVEEEADLSESFHTDSDGESEDADFEAEAGGHDSTKPSWDNETENAKVEPNGNWNSGRAEGYDFTAIDSGYGTSPELMIEEPLSPEEIAYRDIPFRTKHYFLTYLQRILEATCLDYARKHLSKDLKNLEWKQTNFDTDKNRWKLFKLISEDCLANDRIELECWMRIFLIFHSKGDRETIYNAVGELRNAAIHRSPEDIDLYRLSWAMRLPAELDDTTRDIEIQNAFRYVMGDQALNQDTRTAVETAMFTPPACSSHHHLLTRIQTLLEETCFRYASATVPHYLESKKWEIPEQAELPQLERFFDLWALQHVNSADSLFPDLTRGSGTYEDSGSLNGSMFNARKRIRNFAAHHLSLSDEELVANVHLGIRHCLLMGEWHQAIEIEVLAEMYFTQRSRIQVLRRLRGKFQEGKIESSYEQQRRIALRRYLGLAEEESDRDAGLGVEKNENGYWDVSAEGSRAYSTVSPSMHECLKRTVEY